jgi:PAS domain S-box-containing protein
MEKRYRRKDDSLIWVNLHVSLVPGTGSIPRFSLAIVEDITGRKRVEEALRQSEAELREALLAAQMGVWEWTAATDTVTWDENLYRIAGRDPKLPAPRLQEHPQIFAPESWERLKAAAENALATGTPYELDLEMVRPDGSKRWLIGRGEPRREASGHITRLRGTVQDITERKRAEEALRESEERFRTTFEDAGVGMALVDMQGHPIKSNPALRQMLGYSAEELSRMTFTEYTHPEDRNLDWGLYRELVAGKRDKYEIEKRYLKKGGGVVWGLLTVSLVKDRHGCPVYAVGMVQDITERKRVEQALRESDQGYKDFIAHSNEGVWRVDLEQPIPINLPEEEMLERILRYGYIAECNLALARTFGFSSPE